MSETIHVRGEGGAVWEMDLPLPEGVAQRLQRGDLVQVDQDGVPVDEPVSQGAPKGRDQVPPFVTPGDTPRVIPGQAEAPILPRTTDEDDDEGEQPEDAPGKTASKAVWLDYAVDVRGADRTEAEQLTKAELIERYGG